MTESVCTYRLKFLIGSQYPILSGSLIEIELPPELSFNNDDFTEANSFTDGIADLSAGFNVVGGSKLVRVVGAFNQQSAPNGVDWRQDSFSIYIAGINTPRSTAPTLSFKAKIKTETNYIQYKKEQGIYSNVNQAKEFNKAIIMRTNEQNGVGDGYYNFTLQFSTEVKKNEYIKITPPEDIIINPSGDQCKGIGHPAISPTNLSLLSAG